jgi:hypothetical protein
MLPVPVTPARLPRLRPMPVFYANPTLSMLSVMLFPDDLTLARKFVAHLPSRGTKSRSRPQARRRQPTCSHQRLAVVPPTPSTCSTRSRPTGLDHV